MPHLRSIVIHCRDPYVMGPFWSLVTGLPIHPEDAEAIRTRGLAADESVLLGDRSEMQVWITPAEELREPGRVHVDITADEADVAAIVAAGAVLVRQVDGWGVYTDPEGNEFCLVPPSS